MGCSFDENKHFGFLGFAIRKAYMIIPTPKALGTHNAQLDCKGPNSSFRTASTYIIKLYTPFNTTDLGSG